jgi:hypothetical protein
MVNLAGLRGFTKGLRESTEELPAIAMKRRTMFEAQKQEELANRRNASLLAINLTKEGSSESAFLNALTTGQNTGALPADFDVTGLAAAQGPVFQQKKRVAALEEYQLSLAVDSQAMKNLKLRAGDWIDSQNGYFWRQDVEGNIHYDGLPPDIKKGRWKIIKPKLGYGINIAGEYEVLPKYMHSNDIFKADFDTGTMLMVNGDIIKMPPEYFENLAAAQERDLAFKKAVEIMKHEVALPFKIYIDKLEFVNRINLADHKNFIATTQMVSKGLADGSITPSEATKLIGANLSTSTPEVRGQAMAAMGDLVEASWAKVNFSVAESKRLESLNWAAVAARRAMDYAAKNPKLFAKFGPATGRWADFDMKWLGGKASTDTAPEFNRFMAWIGHIKDEAVTRPRTGAAMNEQENEFYKSLLGNVAHSPEAFKQKMETFLAYTEARRDLVWKYALLRKYGEDIKGYNTAVRKIPSINLLEFDYSPSDEFSGILIGDITLDPAERGASVPVYNFAGEE